MKLIIPIKKTAPAPAPAVTKSAYETPEPPKWVKLDHAPRECTHCNHLYGNPCDGKKTCPNYAFHAK